MSHERAPETQSGASLGDVRPVCAKGVCCLSLEDRGTTVCSRRWEAADVVLQWTEMLLETLSTPWPPPWADTARAAGHDRAGEGGDAGHRFGGEICRSLPRSRVGLSIPIRKGGGGGVWGGGRASKNEV